MPTFNEHIHTLTTQLEPRYNDPVLREQTAIWLLEAITNQNAAQLIAQSSIILTPEQKQKLASWMMKIINQQMPLAYVIGSVPFNNLTIEVEPPVLIPRPETEEWVINLIDKLNQLPNKNITILDIGTGSGCVALALAYALPEAQVYATDIAPHAVALAQKNSKKNNISNITIIQSDLFEQIPDNLKFDLIVANPPYIAPDEWQKLDHSVTQWEDKNALIAPQEGLALIEKIITQARTHFKPNAEFKQLQIPNLVIEIGYQQGPIVQQLLTDAQYHNVRIVQDLEHKDRTAQAQG